MRFLTSLSIIALVVHHSVAPPVTQTKKDGSNKENEIDDIDEMGDATEYHRYLKEVFQSLESDPDFRAKIEKAEEGDIRTGKIAHELEFVNHKVRTKLDELKREELERLRHLATKQNNLMDGLDLKRTGLADHIDDSNSRTFEIIDLKKLIAKIAKDLAEVDRRRREEFKQYEMEKKFEIEQKMKGNTEMSEEEKKKYEAELHAMQEKHKQHQPLHHPGSKQQLEEVWEKEDHMENQDFDPRTFFYLHDVDGNGMWDQDEVKALFLKELDKLYSEGAPEDDVVERAEEMERMREHLIKEADLNKDGLISYEEFLERTRNPEFQQDSGWEGLDEQQIYTQEEYEAFEKRRQEEIQKMIAKGMPPPHPDDMPTHHQQFPPQYGHVQSNDHGVPQPPQQQFHGLPPQQAQFHGQQPPHQQYQGHVPQQQYHGQQPHYQGQPPQPIHGQVPIQNEYHAPAQQQQMYQGQVPQQQYQPHAADPHYQGQPQYQQQQHQPQYAQHQGAQQVQHQAAQQTGQQAPQHNQQQAQQHNNPPQVPQQQNPQANAVPQNVQSQPPQQQQQQPQQQHQQEQPQQQHQQQQPQQHQQQQQQQQQQQHQQQQTQQNAQTGQASAQKPVQPNALPHVGKV